MSTKSEDFPGEEVDSLDMMALRPGSRLRFTTSKGTIYEVRRLEGIDIYISGSPGLPVEGIKAALQLPYAKLQIGKKAYFHPEGYAKGINTSPVQRIVWQYDVPPL